MVYYQVEGSSVLSWQFGTNIPGDPTATKQVLDAWALQDPSRVIVVMSPEDAILIPVKNEDGSDALEYVDGVIRRKE